MSTNFTESSYTFHTQLIANRLKAKKEGDISPLQSENLISRWVHSQLRAMINPLLKESNTWLTNGDAYGKESCYLKEHSQMSIASDLSDVYLQELKALNFIDECRSENAERLSLSDSSVD